MTAIQVGYFVGSLSSTSINRVLSRALIRLAPGRHAFHRDPDRESLPLRSRTSTAFSPSYAAAEGVIPQRCPSSSLFVTQNPAAQSLDIRGTRNDSGFATKG